MQPDPRAEGVRWLEQSRRDLDDARYARDGDRHNLACFLAQQAAEKALEAFLVLRGSEAIRGHSVADLCDEAGRLDPAFVDLKPGVAGLDLYYIPTRYPNGLPGGLPADAFDAGQSDRAIDQAGSAIRTVAATFEGEG